MKTFSIYLLGLLYASLLFACGQTTTATHAMPVKEGYKIKVEVKNTPAEEAYLAYYYGNKQYIKDTTQLVDGAFTFEGDTSLDGGICLVVFPPANNYFEILVDKDQYFSLKTDTADFVTNMEVKGSKENEIFYEDLNFLASKRKEIEAVNAKLKAASSPAEKEKLKEEQAKINEEVQAYRAELMEENPDFLFTKVLMAMKDPEVPEAPKGDDGKPLDSLFAFKYYKNHFFDGMDFEDDRLLRTPVFQQRVDMYIDRLTYRTPDSMIKSIDYMIDQSRGNDDVFRYLVVYFLNEFATGKKSKIMGMDAVYVHMVEQYYMSGDAYWVDDSTKQKMVERATAISPTIIGRPAPNFTVKDSKGQFQTLSSLPGKYTIVYFWDYGCGHCKKVTPRLAKAYEKYNLQEKGVTLFTVNINGDVEEWKEKLDTYGLNIEGAINTEDIQRRSGATSTYDIISTPRMYLLDKDKKVMGKQIGVPQLLKILSIEEGFDVDEEDTIKTNFDDLEE